MRVRVVHFSGNYFTVEYAVSWWRPMTTYGLAYTSYSNPDLMEENRLEIFTFDEAEKLAKSLTPEKIRQHEEKQRKILGEAKAKARAQNAERKAKEFSL